MKTDNVADRLDELFNRLDEAMLSPETILTSEAQRENYESIVMFAFRKLQAARYHRQRVEEFIDAQRKEMIELEARSRPTEHELKITSAVMRVTKSSNELAFELCAFFAALRSGVDFLVVVCVQHIKEAQQATSVSTLLKLIAKGKKGLILDVISEDAEWLLWIRDYRDHLVHRLVIRTTGGGQVQWEGDKVVTTPYPIVVPSDTPKHLSDTRRARMLDEPEHRFTVAASKSFVTDANGTTRLIDHSIEIDPAEGYIRIEDLMKREVAAFERFFVRIIGALIKLDFQPMQLEKDSQIPA